MMTSIIGQLKKKKTLLSTILELSTCEKVLLWLVGEWKAWGSWRRHFLYQDTIMKMKESEPGSWNTEPVLPLFYSLDASITTISILLGFFLSFFFFLGNTHKALTYIILIMFNWMKFMKLLTQYVHCWDWDNWSVGNICLLKTTQESPEHPGRPGHKICNIQISCIWVTFTAEVPSQVN